VQASIIGLVASSAQILSTTGNSWLSQAAVPSDNDPIQKSTTWFNRAFKKALFLLLLLLVWDVLKKDTAPAITDDISTTIIIITNMFFRSLSLMYNVQFEITSIYINEDSKYRNESWQYDAFFSLATSALQ
jgi:hypothetical protein